MAAAILATIDDPRPPEVTTRAAAFGIEPAVSAYLKVLSGGRGVRPLAPDVVIESATPAPGL
jgi:hypothetical protein